ncbi:MAG: hypothetical protein QOD57_3411 [Actinomycetota bacterium]|nr:hypothetical protein [Actinomycetota bacterium]
MVDLMKRIPILIAVTGLALLAACGGGGTSNGAAKPAPGAVGSSSSSSTASSTSTASSPGSTAAQGGVNPNGPEVNEAGDIPDNQVFVVYRPPSGGYSVKVPEGWARSEANGAVTFTDKLNGIRMETVDAATAPTVASVTQNDIPPLKAAAKNFEAGTVKDVTRKAGTAVLATYKADSEPNAVTGKVVHDAVERYTFWRAGKTVILTLSGPQGADNVDPWRIVTDSFTWL